MTLFNFIKRELCRYLEHYEGGVSREKNGIIRTVSFKVNPDSIVFNNVVRALCMQVTNYVIILDSSVISSPKFILKSRRWVNIYETQLFMLIKQFTNTIDEFDNTYDPICREELRTDLRRFIYSGINQRWGELLATHIQGWWVRISYLTKGVAFQELEEALEGGDGALEGGDGALEGGDGALESD